MTTIPPLFWMFIISILTLGVFLILVYIALAIRQSIDLIKEATNVLVEAKEIARESKVILSDVKALSESAKESVERINNMVRITSEKIIKPVKSIGNFINYLTSFLPFSLDNSANDSSKK